MLWEAWIKNLFMKIGVDRFRTKSDFYLDGGRGKEVISFEDARTSKRGSFSPLCLCYNTPLCSQFAIGLVLLIIDREVCGIHVDQSQ